MENKHDISFLPQVLLPWYAENKRDLPWRKDHEPYHILISEIMLQQTRVEAVKGYYLRFLEALPTVESLANASQEVLNKLWEGLGYYSRAKNLKKTAEIICNEKNGVFPESYDGLLALPGIGPYTAGAIASIAFNQKTPAVDGNVLRVFARLTDDASPIDSQEFKRVATECLRKIYPDKAGDFTQALMELGATICGPNRKPDCEVCPCREYCKAFQNGTAESLPVKQPKKARKVEEMTVFILCCNGEYALEKRADRGLLAGLWQFPNISGKMEVSEAIFKMQQQGIRICDVKKCIERSHIFTHVQWEMMGIYAEVSEKCEQFQWFSPETILTETALPTAFRQFWDNAECV